MGDKNIYLRENTEYFQRTLLTGLEVHLVIISGHPSLVGTERIQLPKQQ